MSTSLFFELTHIENTVCNYVFELTSDARILQISSDGSYLTPSLDPIICVDLQAALICENSIWYFNQPNEKEIYLVLDEKVSTDNIPVKDGYVIEIKGYRFVVRMQRQEIGRGVSEDDFRDTLSVATHELVEQEQTVIEGLGRHFETLLSPIVDETEDILQKLEKEYFAVLKTPELLYNRTNYEQHESAMNLNIQEDLLSKGEQMQHVSLLEMLEGVMSIEDVEKSLEQVESDIFQMHAIPDDVLDLFVDPQEPHNKSWIAPSVSQKNHRHHSINAPLSVQVQMNEGDER